MSVNVNSLAIALVGAVIFSPAFAADAGHCGAATTQLQMNRCAQAAFTSADAEMNRLFKQQMPHLGADRKKRLLASQRAWLKYRDSACLYETGPRSESGSMWPMQASLCQAAFTRERNATLKKYASCRQDGCM